MSGDQLTICTAARNNQNSQSLWELQWVGHAPHGRAFPCKFCGETLVLHAYECLSTTFQCSARATLKHSEYLSFQGMSGDQFTICAAARSNQNSQSLWELELVGHMPQVFLFKFVGTVWYSMHMVGATFQCNVHSFETLWIFTRNEWGPAYHVRSCKKQSKQPKSLRVAVGWPCAPRVSFHICRNS